MWRPGKARFLNRLEEPAPYPPAATARRRAPFPARAVPGFATSVGYALPPSRIPRHFLILIDPSLSPSLPRRTAELLPCPAQAVHRPAPCPYQIAHPLVAAIPDPYRAP